MESNNRMTMPKPKIRTIFLLDLPALAALVILVTPAYLFALVDGASAILSWEYSWIVTMLLLDILILTQFVQLLAARGAVPARTRRLQILLSLLVILPLSCFIAESGREALYWGHYDSPNDYVGSGLLWIMGQQAVVLWISKWVIRSARGGKLSRKQCWLLWGARAAAVFGSVMLLNWGEDIVTLFMVLVGSITAVLFVFLPALTLTRIATLPVDNREASKIRKTFLLSVLTSVPSILLEMIR